MSKAWIIRAENPSDTATIHRLTRIAFEKAAHSAGTEQKIVDELRRTGALTISLVAELESQLIGHVAISPITIADEDHDHADGWYGLGPISVLPELQGQGVGSSLIQAVLNVLRQMGAGGCVLLGDPNYYGRFGFAARSGLTYSGPPPEYFQSLRFSGAQPQGEVCYHPAFSIS